MANSFMPSGDDALVKWFKKFTAGLPAYVGQCSITPTDVATTQKDSDMVEFVVGFQALVHGLGETFTAFKDNVIEGLPAGGTTEPR